MRNHDSVEFQRRGFRSFGEYPGVRNFFLEDDDLSREFVTFQRDFRSSCWDRDEGQEEIGE